MHDRKKFGMEGEEMAVEYLQQRGFVVVARNWRTRGGEIDIIARRDDGLHFFEVKRRTSLRFGGPYEAVNNFKRYKIRRTAQAYLASHPQVVHRICFGVIGILNDKIEMIKNIYDS